MECIACHLVFDPSRPRPVRKRPVDRSKSADDEPEQLHIDAPPGMIALETRSGSRMSYRDATPGRTESLEIRHPWRDLYGHELWTLVPIVLVSLGLMTMSWRHQPRPRFGDDAWFLIALALVMLLSSAFRFVCIRVNTMVITVGDGWLRLRHTPIPWLGHRTIPARDVEQLYTEHYTITDRNNRETGHAYRVLVRRRGRIRPLTLIHGMVAADQAVYIEKSIERVLGIEDVPVPGELGYRPRWATGASPPPRPGAAQSAPRRDSSSTQQSPSD